MSYPPDYPYVGSYRSPYQIQLDYFKPHLFHSDVAHVSQSSRSSMDMPPYYVPQIPPVFYYNQENGQHSPTNIDYDLIEKELGDGTSTFDPRVNYFHEVSVMAKHHEQLSQRLAELRREVKEMIEKPKEAEKVSESGTNPATGKKKKRRLASEIYKEYKCPYPNCTKFYGSEVSMNLHIKLKHDGGTKTERENFARSLMLANPETTLMSFPSINFPPGYIEKKIIEKREATQTPTALKIERKIEYEKKNFEQNFESKSEQASKSEKVPVGASDDALNEIEGSNENKPLDNREKPDLDNNEADENSSESESQDKSAKFENLPALQKNLIDHYKEIVIRHPECVSDVQYLPESKNESEEGLTFLIRIKLDGLDRPLRE